MRQLRAAFLAFFLALGLAALPTRAFAEDYDLWLVGTQVTSENAADVFGDGTASFDADTNTLTLDGFVATGDYKDSDMLLISAETPSLTVVLKGENVLVASKRGNCFFSRGPLTFTGDGSLATFGGYSPMQGSGNSMGICTYGVLTFAENFTGTVVATGGNGYDCAWGIYAGDGVAVKGGTVIATGGAAASSAGIQISSGSVSVSGGLLVAQGGNSKGLLSNGSSYGICGNGGLTSSFTGGAAVVRAGTSNGVANTTSRRAFSGAMPSLGDNVRVAGSVGYVDGVFTSGVDPTKATGVVIVSDDFTDTDVLDSFAGTASLSGNVCHVTTDGSNFGADRSVGELTVEMNGYTALFVNLCDSADDGATLAGYAMNASKATFSGEGTFAAVGGITTAVDSATVGLHASGSLIVDGPKVVGVAGISEGSATGIQCGGTTAESGSLVGYGGSSGADAASVGINPGGGAVTARGTASVLGVGGRGGINCLGIDGSAASYDDASVAGVGGMLTRGARDVEVTCGIHGTASSYGGVTCGVGGYAINPNRHSVGATTGCAYEGGKVVAMGGPCYLYSYGFRSMSASSVVGGELVAAGRIRAFYSIASQLAFADGLAATGYTNYAGTEGETQIESGGPANVLSGLERIVVYKPLFVYPLFVAGVQVTSENAADLTVIDGVTVAEGGYVRYDVESNTLQMKDATIENPFAPEEGLTDGLTIEGELTIAVEGSCSVCGAPDDGGVCSVWFGEDPVAVVLVDGATLTVGSPELGDATSGAAIIGRGSLSVSGAGTFDVLAPANTEAAKTYALDLEGDLAVADQVKMNCTVVPGGGVGTVKNTGGMYLRGPEATITLSGAAEVQALGFEHGIAVDARQSSGDTFDLHVIAEPGWSGSFVALGGGRALADVSSDGADGSNATFIRSWDTTDMRIYVNPSMHINKYGESYSFHELGGYRIVELVPATSFPVGIGCTQGGGALVTVGEWPHEVESGSAMNLTVDAGQGVTVEAIPDEGCCFVGWYEGVEGESHYVETHTDVLVSADATYTFTPQGYVPLQAVFEPEAPASIPMYRLYNRWSYEHFYTGDEAERDRLVTAGWTYEGIGWYAPVEGDPVYRLYNSYAPGGDHHYTMDRAEYDFLCSVGWTGEGVGWYSDPAQTVPVYREYNPYEQAHNHNYTPDRAEHDHLISVGWRDEGIGWYGV